MKTSLPLLKRILSALFKTHKLTAVLSFFILFSTQSHAQLVTTTGQTADYLIQNILLGSGVTASNVVFTGSANAIGSFSATGTNLGMEEGIVLTTGTIVDDGDGPQGPNDESGCGTNNGIGGYQPLTDILNGIPTYNAAILDFDFVPSSDTVSFSFVFGSEEYPEYVGSGFNDAFAFFISGPGITGTQNISQLPDGTPITINNVNNGSGNNGPCNNCAYYINNGTGSNAPYNSSSTYIQYDGFTAVLEAVSQVICGETYHLTIALADAGDASFDSGVFLKAGSLTSSIPPSVDYALSFSIPNDSNTMGEGCAVATLTIDRGTSDLYSTLVLPIGVTGTATEGVDFSDIPNTITFNPGETSVQFSFSSFFDGVTEGTETIQFEFPFTDECGNPLTEYVDVNITDDTQMFVAIMAEEEDLCFGDQTILTTNITGGVPPYTYTWNTGETTPNITVGGGTYTVVVTDAYGCVGAERTINVEQDDLPIAVTVGNNVNLCYDEVSTVNLTGSVQTATGGSWSGGTGTYSPDNNTINTTYTPNAADISAGSVVLTLTSTGNDGCPAVSESMTIAFLQFNETITLTPQNISCNGASDGSATISTSGAFSPSTYSWDGGAVTSTGSTSGLSPGDHTIQIFNSMGCDTTLTFTITQPDALTGSISGSPLHLCFGDGPADITSSISGGTTPYTYSWNTGESTADITGTNNTFTLTVTDDNGCNLTTNSVTITQDLLPITAQAGDDISVCYDNVGGFALNGAIQTATGGIWSGGNGTFSPSNTNLSANYTPTAAEISNGFIDLTLTTTGNNGCPPDNDIVRITFTAFDETITLDISNVNCNGDADGSLTVTTAGTFSPCTFSFDGGTATTTNTTTGLTPGIHTVQLFNSIGCDTTLSYTITEPDVLEGTISGSPTHLCFGDDPASITSSVSGGTTPYAYAWSSGETTANITGASNTYSLTVTDDNNCTVLTNSVVIDQDAQPILAAAGDDQFYCADFTGSFNITGTVQTATGGIWADGLGTFSPSTTDLAITYTPTEAEILSGLISLTLTTTGNNGCPPHTDTIEIDFSDFEEVITQSITPISCFGADDGSNTITTSGDFSPCTFSWDNGAITANNTISDLTPGTHSFEIYNSIGCSFRTTFEITEPDPLNLVLSPTPSHLCFGDADAVINSTVTGGNSPYTYSWDSGETSTSITGGSGTYTLTIDDANNCGPLSESITITQDTAPITVATNDNQYFCPSFTDAITIDGTVQTAGGGIWSGGLGTYSSSENIISNSYTPTAGEVNSGSLNLILTTTDNNGCPAETDTLKVFFTPFDEAITLDITPISCNGFNDGGAALTTTGSFSPCTYSWDNAAITADSVQTTLTPGLHTVQLFNSSGCDTTLSFIISEPDVLEATISPSYTHLCFEEAPVNISTSVSGGNTPYTYDWGIEGSTSSITAGNGNYQVSVSDANNCPAIILNSVVEQDTAFISVYAGVDQDFCGDYSGTVELNGSFTIATGAYWSGGLGNYSADSSTMLNVYSPHSSEIENGFSEIILTSTGDNGCPGAIDTVQINFIPFNQTITLSTVDVSCFGLNNGSAAVTVSGTSNTFDWDNTGTTTDNFISDLTPGLHQVMVFNYMGCDSLITFTILEPEVLAVTIDSPKEHLCFNEASVTISSVITGGSNPYQYLWNDSSTVATIEATSGSYNLSIEDANGCQVTSSTIVITDDTIQISADAGENQLFCADFTGEISLNGTVETATGGIWSGAEGVFSPNDSTLNVQYTPSQTEIDNGNITLQLISTGNNGCPADTSEMTIQFLHFDENIQLDVTQITCNGLSNGAASVSTSGIYSPCTFSWDGAAETTVDSSFNLSPGFHTLQIVNAMGCDTLITFEIREPELLTVNLTPLNHVLCFDGSSGNMLANAAGGTLPYTYLWNDQILDDDTLENLSAGSYSCLITDANNCSAYTVNFITAPDSLSANINNTIPTCAGYLNGSITCIAYGGNAPYTYEWENGEINDTLLNIGAGEYDLLITDNNGCELALTTTLNEPSPLAMNLPNDTAVCPNANIILNAQVSGGTGSYTYTWSPQTSNASFLIINVAEEGTYICLVKDENGCNVIDSTHISILTLNSADLTAHISDNEICKNDSVQLSVTYNGDANEVDLAWEFCTGCPVEQPFSVAPQTSTEYVISATNICNEIIYDTVSVLVHIPPTIKLQPIYGEVCPQNTVSLENSGDNNAAWTYNWTFGDGTSSSDTTPSHYYGIQGNYPITLMITDEFNCTSISEGESFVVIHPQAVADFDLQALLGTMVDPTINLTNYSDFADEYIWDFGDSTFSHEINPSHEYEYEGTHIVTLYAMNEFECNDSLSKSTTIAFDYTVFAPNAFTPDGYGQNETWNIKFTGLTGDDFTLRIFNRWGDLIHETHDIDEGWNGKIDGREEICQDDVYVWTVDFKDINGEEHYRDGHLVLLK